jgi:PAS domain S-box-containing protein
MNERELSGGGAMGEAMRGLDWSRTALGAVSGWPMSLRTVVRLMLDSRYAMWLAWGPELTFFCNDAYRPTLGAKRGFIGAPASRVWAEIWPDIGPRIEHVLSRGEATWDEGLLLFLERRGYKEETYHSFSYSPVRGDGGAVEGMLCVVTEDTERTLGERRVATLGALSSAARGVRSADEACRLAAAALAADARDLPLVAIHLLDEAGTTARRVAGSGAGADATPAVQRLDDPAAPWPFAEVLEHGEARHVADVVRRIGAHRAGPYPEPVQHACVMPLARPGHGERLAGFLVAGLSPRLPLDAGYERFLALAAAQVGNAIADARAIEEEQRRAAALAEIDRAKTTFFTNVSHEFRTPLALMLGPLEDLLETAQTAAQRELAGTTRRNAQRLLKLVNTLLDFARVEGGRAEARFAPTDLAALTAALASTFRSACERAGLRLTVDCPPGGEPVFVDRDLWEKVVLNLLSNAFKFTFEGGIAVRLRPTTDAAGVELSVADSGIGIAAHDLPKLFQRFQRIEGARGRSFEGSGIGLSLVAELVRLHGGQIGATSEPGRGTTFTVRLPLGRAHLPAERVVPPARAEPAADLAAAYVGEAMQWLPRAASDAPLDSGPADLDVAPPPAASGVAPRVLVVDDNADLRAYLGRLLRTRYRVTPVADGEAALRAALDDPPDLVLSDVMMPGLDGFGLVRRLRADARTRTLPVILLSARAGEEAHIEGLAGGADDYLAKPFSSRELLERVGAHLAAARVRREAEASIAAVVEQSLAGVARTDLAGRFTAANRRFCEIVGRDLPTLRASSMLDITHPDDRASLAAPFGALRRGEIASFTVEKRDLKPDGTEVWVQHHVNLLRDDNGVATEAVALVLDVTEARRADESLRSSQALLAAVMQQVPIALDVTDVRGRFVLANGLMRELVPEAIPSTLPQRRDRWRAWDAAGRPVPPEHWPGQRALRGEVEPGLDALFIDDGGAERWLRVSGAPLRDAAGVVSGAIIVVFEITEQRRTHEALRASEQRLLDADRRKDVFLATLAHELRNPLAPIRNGLHLMRLTLGDPLRQQPMLDMMDRQLAHVVRLVDDLMEVSRITRGKVELKAEVLDLADVLRVAAETAWPQAKTMRCTIELRLPQGPVRVHGDKVRLAQVFTNLLDNAAKYSDEGGRITVTLETDEGMPEAAVWVRDTGTGIPTEMLPRVFDLFTQVDRTLGRAQGGLGIGLALVKSLVQLHGGSVEVASEGPGLGSTFVVRLPRARPAVAAGADAAEAADAVDAPGADADAATLSGRRVLVVDDNRDAADSLARMLEALGAEARTAYDGPSALEVVRTARPSVVLLDLGMPGMDGYAVAAQLRAGPQHPALTLVALTGWGQQDDMRRTRAAGFDEHLVKPVAIELLVQALRAARPVEMDP